MVELILELFLQSDKKSIMANGKKSFFITLKINILDV
jgi:hypothetical protein